MSLKYYLGACLAAAGSLHAVVEKKVDEKAAVPVTFSTVSHNRISVQGGSVEKVFGDNTVFSVTLDNITGNAFINLLRDIGDKPHTLTLVTNSGAVQDLLISSCEGPSEHLLLKEEEPKEDEGLVNIMNFHAVSVELLNKILEGKIPIGYGQRERREEDSLPLPKPLQASTVKVFEGPFENITVYKIQNEGKQTIVITSDSIKAPHHHWVFLNTHELGSKEQAICIIAASKDR